jgi:predicted RNA-binding Zn ribbon-like protein
MPSSSEISQKHPDFVFLGDHPAIDFANTVVISDGRLQDLLSSWKDLVAWFSQAGLPPVPDVPARRQTDALNQVIQLRGAWKEALEKIVTGAQVGDKLLEKLNVVLTAQTFHEALHRQGRNGFQLSRSASPLQGEKGVLVVLARQIAHFLAEAHLPHLHRCANKTSCILFFYDTTKNHRRRWCSVASCGNRHKVAAFRQRQSKRAA